jgi:hypothetical protein
MQITATDVAGYRQCFPAAYHLFNSADFNALNEARCDRLLYLVFSDTKNRLGLIAGVRGTALYSPFSAPFGGFSFVRQDISIAQIEAGVMALIQYASENGYHSIHYTMPPLFYHPAFNNKLVNILHRNNFTLTTVDLNYEFNLEHLTEDYEMKIWHNARKNLRIALKQDFDFSKCDTPETQSAAYNVIKENRARKGYPLKMSYEQVIKTAAIIPADFFLVKKDNEAVAAAIVFHVAAGIVQVIYWGDIPDFVAGKPMNFLSYAVFSYYKKAGLQFVDIGPSTENGIPNHGLCEFKESIGCDVTPKFSFIKILD